MSTDPVREALAELVALKDTQPACYPSDWERESAWVAARAALAQPVQGEPVAWMARTQDWSQPNDTSWQYGPWVDGLDARFIPLYTHPPAQPPRELPPLPQSVQWAGPTRLYTEAQLLGYGLAVLAAQEKP